MSDRSTVLREHALVLGHALLVICPGMQLLDQELLT